MDVVNSINSPWRNRIRRAMEEDIRIIDSSIIDEKEIICTLFSLTGRIYQVSFNSKQIKCSCPYYIQHTHELCKHILFVVLKYFSIELMNSEGRMIEHVFELFPSLISSNEKNKLMKNNLFVSEGIQKKYKQILDQNNKKKDVPPNIRNNDMCIICFDNLDDKVNNTIACPTCKNVLHKDCIDMWFVQLKSETSCPYCRASWKIEVDDSVEEILGIKYLKIS